MHNPLNAVNYDVCLLEVGCPVNVKIISNIPEPSKVVLLRAHLLHHLGRLLLCYRTCEISYQATLIFKQYNVVGQYVIWRVPPVDFRLSSFDTPLNLGALSICSLYRFFIISIFFNCLVPLTDHE